MRDPLAEFDEQFPPQQTPPIDESGEEQETTGADDQVDLLPDEVPDADIAPPPPPIPIELSPALIESVLTKSLQATRTHTQDREEGETLTVADVAVVFIHGMGDQESGDMLAEYVNPSLEWIKRATTDDNNSYDRGNAHQNLYEGVNILERNRKDRLDPPGDTEWIDIEQISRGGLKSSQTTPSSFQPPYVDIEFKGVVACATEEGGLKKVESRRLVAVEAWWAKEFDAPPFKAVAQWGLGVAPALILRQIALVWENPTHRDETTISPSSPVSQTSKKNSGWVPQGIGCYAPDLHRWDRSAVVDLFAFAPQPDPVSSQIHRQHHFGVDVVVG